MALLLPPLGVVSGAVPALVTLRRGAGAGLVVAAVGLVATGVLAWLIFGSPWVGVALGAMQWLPMIVLALVLRQSVSLPLAVLGAGAIGLLVLAGVYLLVPDPVAMWREVLEQVFRPALERADTEMSTGQLEELLDQVARLMSATVAASLTVSLVLSLLLARWWHAMLDNPGGFGREFRELRLGRSVSVAALAVFAAVIFVQTPALLGLAAVLVGVLLFQGLAVVHALVAARGMSMGWLAGMYVLLFLVPQSVPLISLLGLIDNWVNFRARAESPGA
jgi:uncharacterized protein YybS (DUF2232 family)